MSLIRQSSLYLAGRIVPAAIGVGGVAIYTRMLDPKTIGEYAVLLSTTLLINGIGFTWLRIAAFRIASGFDDGLTPDFSATIALLFAATAIVFALIEGVTVHLFLRDYPLDLLMLAMAAVVASGWNDLHASLLQSRLNVVGWGALNLVRALVAIVSSVALISIGFKAQALLGGFVLGNFSALAFGKLWLPALHGKFDRTLFRRCFDFGWPQSVNAAQNFAAPAAQRWVIQSAAGAAAVGIFAVANDFASQTMASLVGSFSLAGIPLAFRAKERNDSVALDLQLKANARMILGIALPAAVGFVFLAQPIAHTFFGAKFWNGAPLLLMLIGASAFAVNMRVYYFDQAFELAMETRPQAVISVIGTALAIALTIVLVPHHAAAGAAVAALCGSLLSLVLSIGWGAAVLRMPIPIIDWMKTVIAAAAMACGLVFLPKDTTGIGLAVALLAGALIYCVVSSVTRFRLVRSWIAPRMARFQRS